MRRRHIQGACYALQITADDFVLVALCRQHKLERQANYAGGGKI